MKARSCSFCGEGFFLTRGTTGGSKHSTYRPDLCSPCWMNWRIRQLAEQDAREQAAQLSFADTLGTIDAIRKARCFHAS